MKTPNRLQLSRQARANACRAFSAVEVTVITVIVVVLVGVFLPVTNSGCIKGPQTKALAQAKCIGLALKLYADDHNGVYPAGTNLRGEAIRTSNDAFRNLFPTYTQSEKIFGNKLSAWQTSPPDDRIDVGEGPSRETLKPGENVYAYMAGLIDDASNPAIPIIADGTDGTGHYTTKEGARGGVWKGTKAIVIRLDNSGALENLIGPENARYVPFPKEPQRNLLDASSYRDEKLEFLDPAASAGSKRK